MNIDFLNQIETRMPEFSKAQKLIARYIFWSIMKKPPL